MTTVSIGVVIPAYRAGDDLQTCIASVLASRMPAGWSVHIVVVDNSGGSIRADLVSNPRVRLAGSGTNIGIAAGRNLGAQALPDADVLVFVDEDVALHADCLSLLARYLLDHPDVGITTPRISYAVEPERTWACGTLISLRTGRVRFVTSPPTQRAFTVDVAPSVIAVRQSSFQAVGGFDPDFFAVYEDTDFCLRMRARRLSTCCLPQALALHNTPIDTRDAARHLASRAYWIGRNRVLFVRRHGSRPLEFFLLLPLYALYYAAMSYRAKEPWGAVKFLQGTLVGSFTKLHFRRQLARPGWTVVAIVTALVVVWYHRGLQMGYGDGQAPFLRVNVDLQRSWYLWDSTGTGGVNPQLTAGAGFWALMSVARLLTLPAWLLEAATYWACLVIGGVAAASLASWHSRRPQRAARVSAIVYLLGPYTIFNVLHRFILPYVIFFAYLPAMIALLRRWYRSDVLWPFLLIIVASPVFAIAFVTPGFAALIPVLIVLDYLCVRLLPGHKRDLWKCVTAIISWFCVNAYWEVPLLFQAGATIEKSTNLSPANNLINYQGISYYLGLSNGLRSIIGTYGRGQGVSWPYDSHLWLAILFLFPLVAFAALLLRPSRDICYIAALSLLGAYASSGDNVPGGQVLDSAMRSVTALGAFRNPYELFGYVYFLFAAVLVGVTVAEVQVARSLARVLAASGAVLVGCSGWPAISGSVFSNARFGSFYLQVPEPYLSLGNTVRKIAGSGARVVVAPLTDEGITYRWRYGYRGADILQIVDRSALSAVADLQLSAPIKKALRSFPFGYAAASVPRLLGARLVAVRTDVNPEPGLDNLASPARVARSLRSSSQYRYIRKYSPLIIFRVKGCTYSLIFSAGAAERVATPSWKRLAAAANARCALLVSSPAPRVGTRGGIEVSEEARSLRYLKWSPVAYVVSLPSHFVGWVVLNSAWSPGWSGRVVSQLPRCPAHQFSCLDLMTRAAPRPAGPYLADSFANGWYVRSGGKKRFLLLLFTPQEDVDVGGLFSAMSLLTVIIIGGLWTRHSHARGSQQVPLEGLVGRLGPRSRGARKRY